MAGLYTNSKFFIIQLLVVVVLLFGNAEAKTIETGLWGIGWDTDASKLKQSLEVQGFSFIDQGKDTEGNQWQRFGNGLFSGFKCDVKVAWQANLLSEINIESTEPFLLGTEFTYRNLLSRFTDEYGQPQERDGYMLKIFPGVWVEWAKWTVTNEGVPAFEVTIVQNRVADGFNSNEATPSKISVSFKKITKE